MNKQQKIDLENLEKAYQTQMAEVRENIKTQVYEEFGQEKLDRAKSQNAQARTWNGMGSRFRSHHRDQIDSKNTEIANDNRLNKVQTEIDEAIETRSQKIGKDMGAEIFEAFGGREAALKQLEEYNDKRKEEVKGRAQNDFDEAIGKKPHKLDMVKDKAREAFQEASQNRENKLLKVKLVEPEKDIEKEGATVKPQVLSQQKSESLDAKFWSQAKEKSCTVNDSTQLTTSKESSYDAKMAARISKSFNRSRDKDKSISL